MKYSRHTHQVRSRHKPILSPMRVECARFSSSRSWSDAESAPQRARKALAEGIRHVRPQLTDRRRLGRVGPHRVRRNRLCRPTISQRRRLEHTLTVTGNCANVIGGAGITIKFDRVDKQIDLKTSPPMWTATPGTGGPGSGKKITTS